MISPIPCLSLKSKIHSNVQLHINFLYKMISLCKSTTSIKIGFEILTAMFMKSIFFWAVMPCKFRKSLIFQRNISSPSSGPRVSQARNEKDAGNKQSHPTCTVCQICRCYTEQPPHRGLYCWISGSHSSDYKKYGLLSFNVV
jgi:hypothetical protein